MLDTQQSVHQALRSSGIEWMCWYEAVVVLSCLLVHALCDLCSILWCDLSTQVFRWMPCMSTKTRQN